MARELFGTDGVRGAWGDLLTVDLALAIGDAAVTIVEAERPRAVILRDTRESGPALEAALAAGVAAAGGDALLAGVLPTPAAPMLISRYGFDLAFVVSASHNPYGDNGIKIFGPDGDKIPDADEEEIERLVAEGRPASASHPGTVEPLRGALEDYLRDLHERHGRLDLSGVRVLLDCANGSTSAAGPEIFRRLGAEVDVLAASPDGRNINERCGSTHIEALAETIAQGDWDVGFAFDGDGDRVLAVDGAGQVVDGDDLLLLLAGHMMESGTLRGGVALTVMANFGLHTAFEELEIEVETTPVGDRHVLARLRETQWRIGGEQSGHIIDLDAGPCGDGIGTALLALEALDGKPLAERAKFDRLPQTLVNVRVPDRSAFEQSEVIAAALKLEAEALEGRGRLLVRPSGTEPLIRVMAEAPTAEEAEAVCARLSELVERELGG
jgi:phosphoglucosamine mutase